MFIHTQFKHVNANAVIIIDSIISVSKQFKREYLNRASQRYYQIPVKVQYFIHSISPSLYNT